MPEESAGEKIFPATAHRRMEARKKGTVARSMDMSGALVLLSLMIALHQALTSGLAFASIQGDIYQAFVFNPHPFGFTLTTFRHWQLTAALWMLRTVGPILAVAFVVGLAANIAQVGLVVSIEAAAPDWNRVNPAKGFERMFSMRGTAELLKGICKIVMIGWICWYEVYGSLDDIISSASLPLPLFLSHVGDVIWSIAIRVAVLLAGIAVADYAFQKQQYEKMMRMSREEMKQEVKQQDGDPLIKQRIRQKQRQLAKNRMMHAVPTADVVITNPTHFAVALKYDPKTMKAPKVVAKGQDEVALAIKELARESKVPLVENRPLARSLFDTVKLNKDVPPELFRAVAEVLAFIYRTYGRRKT
jgi:flagellar biosynthesis protein FlhB